MTLIRDANKNGIIEDGETTAASRRTNFALGGLTLDSKQLEHGCRMVYCGFPSFFGLWVRGRSCSTSWLLLQEFRNLSVVRLNSL